jgi:hypothetical protein
VTGLPPVLCKDDVCAGCVLKKYHRESFDKRASWHASGPLQLVHSDLCGPLSSPFSGCKYFLTFYYHIKLSKGRNMTKSFVAHKRSNTTFKHSLFWAEKQATGRFSFQWQRSQEKFRSTTLVHSKCKIFTRSSSIQKP